MLIPLGVLLVALLLSGAILYLARGTRSRVRPIPQDGRLPGGLSDSEFRDFMRTTYPSVLPIRIAPAVQKALSSSSGRNASHEEALLVIMVTPLCAFTLLYLAGHKCTGDALFWLIYWVVLTYLELDLGRRVWDRLVGLSPDISRFLHTDYNRAVFAGWLRRWLVPKRQVGVALVAAVMVLIALRFTERPLAGRMSLCEAYYLSVLINSLLLGMNLYWLLALPLMIRHLTKYTDVEYLNIAPVRTPAVFGLSRLLAYTAFLTAAAFLVAAIPVLWALAVAPRSPFLQWLNVTIAIIGTAVLIFDTVMPQVWLSRSVSRAKRGILTALAAELDRYEKRHYLPSRRRVQDVREQYRLVSESHSFTVSPTGLLTYSGAFIASAVPVVIQIVFLK